MKTSLHDSSPSARKGAPPRTPLLALFGLEKSAPEIPKGVKLSELARRDFKGEFREARLCDAQSGPAQRVLLIGLGKLSELAATQGERLRRAAAIAVQRAEALGCAEVSLWCPPRAEWLEPSGGARQAGSDLVEGALMGSYRYQDFKSKPKEPKLKSIALHGPGREFRAGAQHGQVLAEANCFARDLQNAPANRMRPRDLAAAAHKLERASERISCHVLNAEAMRRLGMGALLGVSQGSEEPPQLIHLSYKPKGRSRGRIALVGKGLTFDAGGISIKPASKMWEMKYDMSGGAAVLGVFHALARLDVPFQVHGLVPASENLPSGTAVKPGDLVTAMNGTTIEVLNTDAEGRLILADALAYAVAKLKPDTIVDLATLTGAVVVALGHELSGIFTSSKQLEGELLAAGEAVGEKLWPLPLLEHHREQMKGEVADLKNINAEGSGGGASAGAAFLAHFTGETEWAHLDIAGTAWGGTNRDYVGGPQGSGVGVRLLLRWLETRA
jgi:leucyl aminopeptidase